MAFNIFPHLSSALPESISATLSQTKDIHVVERNQMANLIKEIELGQTGLFDERSVIKAGKMLQADVLFLGSFSGNPVEIILSMKAVDIKTGKVLDGRVVKAPLASLFDAANNAAVSMSALISGRNIGLLSVSSNPDGCDIYFDGVLIGKSPIVELKTTAGKHRLKAVKSGCMDAETEITVGTNTHASWTPYLAESKLRNRTEIGFGVYYFRPVNSNLDAAPLYSLFIGQSIYRLNLAGEFAYSKIEHSQTISSPFGAIKQDRWYQLFIVHAHIAYVPMELGPYVMPYLGIFGGYGRLIDYRKNKSHSEDEEKLSSRNIWSIGPKIGLNVAPFSKVSIFFESRFLYTPVRVERRVWQSRGVLGDLTVRQTKYYFNAFSIGAGVKIYFN